MQLINIKIKNYRLLIDAELDVDEKTTLIVGRNNTAKTSCNNCINTVLQGSDFSYNDYPLSKRENLYNLFCNGVQREHNKKLNNGLPILRKVPPKRDYGRYFCIMAEKGGTSHGGLTEKLSLFFHAKKQEVNAYGR